MNYRTQIVSSLDEIGQASWDALVATQQERNPFLSFAFLHALHATGCASPDSGWQPQYLTLWRGQSLEAALPLYVKSHSYGEYVFDWAWADAYRRNGLDYYPKLLSAIPFTPVAGSRLLARTEEASDRLIEALYGLQEANGLSSTHILFPPESQARKLKDAGFMLRTGVQFHWVNQGYRDFEDFLSTLDRKKRKNIRAERRKVREADVTFRHVPGTEATEADWRFFKRCYDRTYAAHYSTPYLNLAFFQRLGRTMPQHLRLIVAERHGRPVACSFVVHDESTLYGRYWGTMEDIPCLHFETAYYQPLDFCIAQKIPCFEGGAQGEHKMARGFLPHRTWSAHWLAHPAFADAVERFLQQEAGGIDAYLDELNDRQPYREMR
ncbi:GNAT family N-acetyltransferase [Noviherbaspirillum sp. ST9]|uniref:GNAT family N-acetyltransferase n=1 Tax=Noviherbaspirillum sp. ST9 TaxID=3401606 RepID=UPI003B587DAF